MRKKLSLFVMLLISMMNILNAQGVGQTAGSFSVSPGGGANYTVPIKTLPGIKEMIPEIALSYSHQGGNGIAGWGWNITGVSSITRIPSTKFHDGMMDGVDYDSYDRFALDGQRLVLKSGTYGQDGAEYQTENYSNLKITSHGQIVGGPLYFLVYYPDGKVARYGYSDNNQAGNTFEWKINQIEDANFNRIKFLYESYDSNIYIKSIQYGNNSSLNPSSVINTINFYYKDVTRNEVNFIYSSPRRIRINKKLDKVEVLGGNQLYRKYQLTYNTTSLNYDRLVQVQEFNGVNESLKPITFEYDTTQNGVINDPNAIISNVSPGFDTSNWQYVSGYFDRDGALDFMTYPNSKDKLYRFNSSQLTIATSNVSGSLNNVEKFTEVFSTKIVLPNNKFNNLDAVSTLVESTGITTDSEVIKINNYTTNTSSSTLDLAFSNSYTFPTIQNQRCFAIGGNDIYYSKMPKKYFSGDFDGDGISDILTITLPYYTYYPTVCNNGPGGPLDPSTDPSENPGEGIPTGCCDESYYTDYAQAFLLKMDANNSAVQQPQSIGWNNVIKSSSKIYVADFEGDGMSDLYVVNPGIVYVFGMKNGVFEQKISVSSNLIKADFPHYTSDMNGDGKTDLVIPIADDNSNWFFIIANGEDLKTTVKDIGVKYRKSWIANQCYPAAGGGMLCGYMQESIYFNFADINGDGKGDIFSHRILAPHNYPNGGQWNYPYQTYGSNYTIRDQGIVWYNMNNDINGNPEFSAAVDTWQNNYTYGGSTVNGSPMFLSNQNAINQNLDYAFFGADKIKYITFKKDNRTDVLLKRVKENDILTSITYSPVIDNGNGVYTDDTAETYPYVNINVSPSTLVVSKVSKSFGSETKIQDFRYKGAVMHLDGFGFLGFKGNATSSVYSGSTNSNDIMWTITKQDMLKRGANVESYLLKGFVDYNSPTNFITKSTKSYNTSLLSNKVFVNMISQSDQIDNLTGITRSTIYEEYDSFYNLKKAKDVAPGGEKVTTFEFDNNPGGISNQYYIGRPLKKTVTKTLGTETFSTEQQFVYSGIYLTQLKKKGNGTDYLVEDYLYDDYGNMSQKTLSVAGMTPRVEAMQYDISGRYIVQTTNVLGFKDKMNYDFNFGLLLSKTNYLNQTFSYTYDGWQKKTKETDFYNKETLYNYEWITSSEFLNGIKFRVTDPTGAIKETYTDVWGRKRLERELSINNKWIDRRTEYDVLDRPHKKSDPYFSTNTATRWTISEFDEYGRGKKVTFPTGKVVTSSYSGLSSTVVDGQKVQTVTNDAWGNKVKMADNGGEINYTYFANGNLKSANYGGHIVSIEQNGWGAKTKMSDPSVGGDYTYTYDNFGQLLTEENPKGKTTYTYDAYGRVATKKVQGDNTDIRANFTYDTNGLLTSEAGTSNGIGNSFTYEYDTYFRNKKKTETIAGVTIDKIYTFDDFGRINTELTETHSSSNVSSFKIENVYAASGDLEKIKDVATGTVIWKLNDINEKGQVLSSTLGNGVQVANAYDSNYYLTSINHTNSSSVAVVNNTYSFNVLFGTLNSRSNNAIQPGGWNEIFEYDNLLRLTSWTDPNGTQTHTYDNYGRIDKNSDVGDYKYVPGNRYRKGTIALNAAGDAYYSVNQLQQIEYNANRLPVKISQDGFAHVLFNYNIHQKKATSAYDYIPSYLIYEKNKIYSDDKSVEVLHLNQIGRPNANFISTKIYTYIGGDAYTAQAVYIQDFTVSGLTRAALHYIHRDYQGSVLAFSDEVGNVEEKRHFDAWGNIVKIVDGNGIAIAPQQTLLERGYTGHEHFFAVGLIHMNGRMYDPKLHTFLSVDNFVSDPYNTQSYNRYGYVLNNPLLYTDPSGEEPITLAAIGLGMLYGALIGSAIAVVTYSIPALLNGSWNLRAASKSALYGAVTGAISGGIGAAAGASAAGSFWQSSTMNMLTSVASQVGTGLVMGDKIGWATVVSGLVSGYLGGKMENFSAFENGGYLSNVAGELIYNSGTGALLGSVSGTVAAAISGGNVGDGMKRGMINGAIGSASQTIANIALLGAVYMPKKENLGCVEELSTKFSTPTKRLMWRHGGIIPNLFSSITIGENIGMNRNDVNNPNVYGHEFAHYVQQYRGQNYYRGNSHAPRPQGWAVFQMHGIIEQWILRTFMGIEPYVEYKNEGMQYNEFDAEYKLQQIGGCTITDTNGNCIKL
ncbi:RHS repeat-associated core domain-containing protein [Chryseobacterium daeguense]|uniref:RHS repeat-associated core domain-containing protein n=1 Tax=Chryseobacterium daeguense TaxID=412438 RepID=UPI0009D6F61F|nr:RHS repeat-associated core domain-containing protein [Chryseobacterium daeguense]